MIRPWGWGGCYSGSDRRKNSSEVTIYGKTVFCRQEANV